MSDAKKIIVDEDWKSRVAAEKEAAAARGAGGEGGEADPGDEPPGSRLAEGGAVAGEPDAGAAAPYQLPPASFEMLVTTLATEAMIGLGQYPHPMTGKVHADAAQARYAIDMLEMLAEKTRGNLTSSEDRGLRELLHQLRMAFVAQTAGGDAARKPAAATDATPPPSS